MSDLDIVGRGDVLEVTLAVRVADILPDGRVVVGDSNLALNLDSDVKAWRHLDSDDA